MTKSLQIQHDIIKAIPLDIETLQEPATYNKKDCAWFFDKEGPNWLLSNMAGHMPITFDNHKWNSSEQLYQASKYASDIICIPNGKNGKGEVIPYVRKTY